MCRSGAVFRTSGISTPVKNGLAEPALSLPSGNLTEVKFQNGIPAEIADGTPVQLRASTRHHMPAARWRIYIHIYRYI